MMRQPPGISGPSRRPLRLRLTATTHNNDWPVQQALLYVVTTLAASHIWTFQVAAAWAKSRSQQYSTSILSEVQTGGLRPLFARLDRTSLERERL